MREVIADIELAADSPRQARYHLTLLRIAEGYIIQKRSGAKGAGVNIETWWRETLVEAKQKYQMIIRTKCDRQRKRQYYELKEPTLF